MINCGDAMERARAFLVSNLEAKIGEDREWRCMLPQPINYASPGGADFLIDSSIVVPYVKVSMHPAQFERLLGLLVYVVDPEQRDDLAYRTPREMQAYDVLMEMARQRHLRETHPTVREAYDQYITAIKLCT